MFATVFYVCVHAVSLKHIPCLPLIVLQLICLPLRPYIFIFLSFFPPRSHGEATRGAETAVGEAMSDQPGAAEAKQRPG